MGSQARCRSNLGRTPFKILRLKLLPSLNMFLPIRVKKLNNSRERSQHWTGRWWKIECDLTSTYQPTMPPMMFTLYQPTAMSLQYTAVYFLQIFFPKGG